MLRIYWLRTKTRFFVVAEYRRKTKAPNWALLGWWGTDTPVSTIMPQGESVSASSVCAASDGAAACPPGYVEGANSNDGPGGVGSTDGNNCSPRLRAKGVHIMGSSCTGPVPDRPRLEQQWTVQDADGGLDERNLMPPPAARQRRAQVEEAAPSSSAV